LSVNSDESASYIGLQGSAQADGTRNYTQPIQGFSGTADSTTSGTTTYLYGGTVLVRNYTGGGIVTNASGLRILSAVNSGGGTITNLSGLWIESQSVGTNNYAIYTNTGDCRIGDDLILNGADSDKLWLGAGKDMSLYYNGTDGYIKTSEVAASDLHITTGTAKTLVLDTVVYNDIYLDIQPKSTGAGKPTLSTFSGNIQKYTFAINDITELGTNELLHDWKEGTAIELHVHWASNGTDASDRYVKWEIDYTWANTVSAGGTTAFAAATTVSAETTIPTSTNVDKTHYYTSIATFTPTGGKIGAALLLSLKRIAASSTAPTNNPWCLMVGVHYQIDTIGSRSTSSK
jgi:hypothetical protein